MTLIFVGGCRSVGKTTQINKICKMQPQFEHIIVVREMVKLKPVYQQARRIPKENQLEAIAKIIKRAKKEAANKTVILDGHYVGTHRAREHIFFPLLQEVADQIDKFIILEREIQEIRQRRLDKGKKLTHAELIRIEADAELAEFETLRAKYQRSFLRIRPEELQKKLE